MTLRTSADALRILEAFEDVRLKGYLCPAGQPTIGAGLTTAAIKAAGEIIRYTNGATDNVVHVGMSISREEADRLEASVVDHFENAIEAMLKGLELATYQFDALVLLGWNIGLEALRISRVIKLTKARDFAGAAAAFAAWNKAHVGGKLVVIKGLVRRRAAERALYEGDLEEARRIAAGGAGPMPQRVALPAPAKPLVKSTELPAAGAVGIAGLAEVGNHVSTALDQAQSLKDKAEALGILDILRAYGQSFEGLLALVIVAGAAWWIWRRVRRAMTEENTSAAGAVDLAPEA